MASGTLARVARRTLGSAVRAGAGALLRQTTRPHLGPAVAQGLDHRGPRAPAPEPVIYEADAQGGRAARRSPQKVLEGMVAARIHLDAVSPKNGPLKVIPGSHHTGKMLKLGDTPPHSILVNRGITFRGPFFGL